MRLGWFFLLQRLLPEWFHFLLLLFDPDCTHRVLEDGRSATSPLRAEGFPGVGSSRGSYKSVGPRMRDLASRVN